MKQKFKETYKYEKSEVQQACENNIALKFDKEYEKWADTVGVGVLKYFFEQYNGVKIEIPKMREKSQKSIIAKIKKLQIERLSKLYLIDGISDKQKKELYELIAERVMANKELDSEDVLVKIKSLLIDEPEKMNIDEIEECIMQDGISINSKTALLRILVGKVKNSNLENKKQILGQLNEKYGEKAALRTGIEEDDIIKYASIKEIGKSDRRLTRLRDSQNYLKANDLRGMKIVVVDIPDDFETENEYIKELLEKRRKCKSNKERMQINHLCSVEIGREFYENIQNNKELLENLHMDIIPNSSKHTKKTNGYEAEHIKFISTENPEYTLELQYKSEYVEGMCRGNGTASHENRPGKSRILPEVKNDEEMINKLKLITPKYKIFIREGNEIKIEKLNMLKNVMSYFQDQILPGEEEYDKIVRILEEKEENQERHA